MSSYIFVDGRVGELVTQFSGAGNDSRIVLLDPARDGLQQIAQALEGVQDLQAIHIVSHGASGALYLGDSVVDGDCLASYRSELFWIGASLADRGDILLYGCDVARGDAGKRFVGQLAALTGADVAASSDATGGALLGGNWDLEVAVGTIKTAALSAPNYAGLLAVINGDGNSNNLVGTANADQITGLGGNDTIDGAGDIDTAIFSGASSGYAFSRAGGNFVVTDTNSGNGDDGADRLANVENLQFSDGVIRVGVGGAFGLGVGNSPAGAVFADGGFVAVWEKSTANPQAGPSNSITPFRYHINAQRYDAAGVVQGVEFQVNSERLLDQRPPAIVVLSNGGFVVAWAPVEGSPAIYARRYDPAGLAQGDQFPLTSALTPSTPISLVGSPAMTALTDGGFVVTWNAVNQDGSGLDVYAQRYDPAAVARGVEFRINNYTNSNQRDPAIASLADGGFIVTWDSLNQFSPTSSDDIYARRYDAQGTPAGIEFRVNSSTTERQNDSSVAALLDGGFVVTWTSGAIAGDVFAQRYDAAGVAVGTEFRVNSATNGEQSHSTVAALSGGGFVVSWLSALGNSVPTFRGEVYAQRYDAAGVAQGAAFLAVPFAGASTSAAVTALPDGGFIVTSDGVYGQRYDDVGNAVAGAVLTGDGGDNVLRWNGGDGVSLDGGPGDDTLAGGAGNDILNGGPGNDTVDYSLSLGVLFDASDSRIFSDGRGGSDILISIENLIGSGFHDDLKGNDSANSIFGGGGDDVLEGNAGDDTIFGGIANDTIGGGADNDVLHGENGDDLIFGGTGNDVIYGGENGDTLIGDSGNDLVYGGAWADAIDGRDGSDVLYGDAGPDIIWGDGFPAVYGFSNDSLFGGDENDMLLGEDANSGALGAGDALYGEAGNDTLDGGGGNDTIYGGTGNDVIDGDHGNDLIYGGPGSEVMLGSNAINYGGPTQGSDLFVYLSLTDGGDSIYGFDTRPGEGDGIDLRPLFDELGYTGTNARSDGYLYVFQNFGNTDVYIDSDGAANGANLSVRLFTLVDTYSPVLTDDYFLFQ